MCSTGGLEDAEGRIVAASRGKNATKDIMSVSVGDKCGLDELQADGGGQEIRCCSRMNYKLHQGIETSILDAAASFTSMILGNAPHNSRSRVSAIIDGDILLSHISEAAVVQDHVVEHGWEVEHEKKTCTGRVIAGNRLVRLCMLLFGCRVLQ
jgi:hypothetical protein